MDLPGIRGGVIPVTGAAAGIGLAIAKQLRSLGARPLLLDIDAAQLDVVAREIYGDDNSSNYTYVVDVSDSKTVDACLQQIRNDHGPVTHAVSNAGIVRPEPVLPCQTINGPQS